MSVVQNAAQVLDRQFLEMRGKVLDLAADLDRIDRAGESAVLGSDRRTRLLRESLKALLEPGPGRAERVQMIFSLQYDPQWREG